MYVTPNCLTGLGNLTSGMKTCWGMGGIPKIGVSCTYMHTVNGKIDQRKIGHILSDRVQGQACLGWVWFSTAVSTVLRDWTSLKYHKRQFVFVFFPTGIFIFSSAKQHLIYNYNMKVTSGLISAEGAQMEVIGRFHSKDVNWSIIIPRSEESSI